MDKDSILPSSSVLSRDDKKRQVLGAVTGSGEGGLVSVPIELHEPDMSEFRSEARSLRSFAEVFAGFAPDGAHVDDQLLSVLRRLLAFLEHSLGDLGDVVDDDRLRTRGSVHTIRRLDRSFLGR